MGPASATAPPPQPRINHATLSEQVYGYLREQILTNAVAPDASLPEESLAQALNVSRVPVREALRRLAAEGLVVLTPRQGAVVSSLSAKQFLDAYRVREALEALAVRLAVPRLDAGDIAELERLQREMALQAQIGDSDAFFTANAAFHRLFVERADNGYLQALYPPLMDQMRRFLSPSLDLRGGMRRSLDEHEDILRAVRAGDGDAAARLISDHIRVPQRMLEQAESAEQAALSVFDGHHP
jgi:DNA-binding GntR family transcriptional regulator